MKYLATLSYAILFAACNTAPAANTNSTANEQKPAVVAASNAVTDPVDFLVLSAAADFREHGPDGPLQFRNVRAGYVPGTDGKDQYLLCGEFVRTEEGTKNSWTKFATIKTSDYEQYIGDNVYCQKPNIVWDPSGDISSRLQRQFESQQKSSDR
jgi:hypothetical protein